MKYWIVQRFLVWMLSRSMMFSTEMETKEGRAGWTELREINSFSSCTFHGARSCVLVYCCILQCLALHACQGNAS